MRMLRASALAVIPLAVLLTACTPPAPEPVPEASSEAPAPAPAPAPDPLAEDVLMVVNATATADNGAVLDLSLTIHRSLAWDDPAGASRAALMTSVCSGGLDDSVYESGLWSFASIDVDAVARTGPTWPADHRLFFLPYATYVTVGTDGFPIDDDEVDPATPHCVRSKFFEGPGTGTAIVGFAGDTDEFGAAGNFTHWANHNYGFSVVRVSSQTAADVGMALSDCSYEVTDAGLELNGDADWWASHVEDTRCVFGSDQEDTEY
jgi:hypothetical protein